MLTVSVMVVDPAQDFEDKSLASDDAVSVCVSKWRKLDPQTVPVEAKASANYLNGMVARQEAAKRGFDYAVLLDTQGYVAEGSTESIFLVQDGRLVTPITGTIINSANSRDHRDRHSAAPVASSKPSGCGRGLSGRDRKTGAARE